jgi:hypothetical protein
MVGIAGAPTWPDRAIRPRGVNMAHTGEATLPPLWITLDNVGSAYRKTPPPGTPRRGRCSPPPVLLSKCS